MAKSQTYIFKPMKGLTFWTLLLLVLRLLGLVAYGACQAIQAASGVRIDFETGNIEDPLTALTALSATFYLFAYVVSGIASLYWIYGAARNALALRPGMDISPGWAVGWYFVPFANLFKPYQYMQDIWTASAGTVGAAKTPRFLLAWWLLNIVGNLASGIASRFTNLAIEDNTTADLGMSAAGMGLLFMASALFFVIVRRIHRNQLSSNTRVAEVF